MERHYWNAEKNIQNNDRILSHGNAAGNLWLVFSGGLNLCAIRLTAKAL
jgi:hypothetical protein